MEKRPLWMGSKKRISSGGKMKLNEKEELARTKVCMPLDGLASMAEARDRVKELSPVVGLFKVGMELYTRCGPDAVGMVQEFGANVFLDLKYKDTPRTVYGAAKAATELGVYMFDVHADGCTEMMEAAVQGAKDGAEEYGTHIPKIIGVTVLTSFDEKVLNEQAKIPGSMRDHVLHLAKMSHEAGLDGIVCAGLDLQDIVVQLPSGLWYVTPGIKGPKTPIGPGQKRVCTPGVALKDGSKVLVIGSAITDQPTPELRLQAGYEVLQDMAQYL